MDKQGLSQQVLVLFHSGYYTKYGILASEYLQYYKKNWRGVNYKVYLLRRSRTRMSHARSTHPVKCKPITAIIVINATQLKDSMLADIWNNKN